MKSHHSTTKRLKVLFITNWYPEPGNYIKAHVDSLKNTDIQAHLIHAEIITNSDGFFIEKGIYNEKSSFKKLHIPFKRAIFVEFFNFLLILNILFVNNKFDIYNFVIAYPQLTFLKIIKFFLKKPLFIMEHWSAYHFNFYLQDKSKGRQRIGAIFKNNIPLLCVSKSLAEDIVKFSEKEQVYHIIPNVVDDIFSWKDIKRKDIFILSGWDEIKRPELIIDAFIQSKCELLKNIKIRFSGFGEKYNKLKEKYNNNNSIIFLGKLERIEIAQEMVAASVFTHATEYETFSIVCAEALCSGTPVIASDVGAISELINDTNGLLVKNDVIAWQNAIEFFFSHQVHLISNKAIYMDANKKYRQHVIGSKLSEIFKKSSL